MSCQAVTKPIPENPNPGPMIREWETPIQSPASGYRDPVSRIAAWLIEQPVGKSFTAKGVNLNRLKLAAVEANGRLGYTAFSISKAYVTRRLKQ